jgi:hypothetical protein
MLMGFIERSHRFATPPISGVFRFGSPSGEDRVHPTWQPEEIPLGDGRVLVLEDSRLRSMRSQIAASKTILGLAGRRTSRRTNTEGLSKKTTSKREPINASGVVVHHKILRFKCVQLFP